MNVRITDLLRDTKGALWIASSTGLIYYNGTNFINYPSTDHSLEVDIISICEGPDGLIYLATSEGVLSFDGHQYKMIIPRNRLTDPVVWSLYVAKNGCIWMGTEEAVVAYYGNRMTYYQKVDGLSGKKIKGIYEKPEGVMWFATDNGISRLDLNCIDYTIKDGLASDQTFKVYSIPKQGLWVGTEWSGFSAFDGDRFHELVPSFWGRNIFREPNGNIWLGTEKGILLYTNKQFVPHPLMDNLWTLATHVDPEGAIWIGHGWGGKGAEKLWRNEKGQWEKRSITTQNGLVNNDVYSIYCDKDGSQWFGTGAGLSRYDGKQWTHFNQTEIGNRRIWAIKKASSGMLWFGTENGLYQYDGKEITNSGFLN